MVRQLTTPPPTQHPRRMSFEEWLRWDPGDNVRSEWVDGEVIIHVSTTLRHGRIIWFLSTLLGLFVQRRQLGEIVAQAVPIRLGRTGRVPDILFVGNERLG